MRTHTYAYTFTSHNEQITNHGVTFFYKSITANILSGDSHRIDINYSDWNIDHSKYQIINCIPVVESNGGMYYQLTMTYWIDKNSIVYHSGYTSNNVTIYFLVVCIDKNLWNEL